jgi:hypothetical protein
LFFSERAQASSRSTFDNDVQLQDHISIYSKSLTEHRHLFLLQFTKNCGQSCHTKIETKVSELGYSYDLVNVDHGLLYCEQNIIESLATKFTNVIIDWVPLIPSLKIDKDLDIPTLCSTIDVLIPLHLTLLSMTSLNWEELSRILESHNHSFSSPLSERTGSLESSVTIDMRCDNAYPLLHSLTHQPYVQWIEVRPLMTRQSFWANGVVQSGDWRIPILKIANLTGHGSIIGIGDTGIDEYSCFFYDKTTRFPFNSVNYNHRKVVYYNTYGNGVDDDGHGTAVSGTAAGSCPPTETYGGFDGAASGAKIAFFDNGKTDGSLSIPSDINKNIFMALYDVGAFVQSMSWGSTSNKYTTDAR